MEPMQRLRAIAPRMNQSSNAVTLSIELVEESLAKLNLGIEVRARVSESENEQALSYERDSISKSWCILWHNLRAGTITRLVNAPLAIRVRAWNEGWISPLLEQLAVDAEEVTKRTEAAARRCDEIRDELRKSINEQG